MLYFFIPIFCVITAVEKLDFNRLSGILSDVIDLSGHILFGMITLLLVNQISRFVGDYFTKTGQTDLSSITSFATLGLFLAISLRYMGIAADIVNLAFGLMLGALAVAFGFGGREAARDHMKQIYKRLSPLQKVTISGNGPFGDISIILNSLMLRHHRGSKNKNIIQNLPFSDDPHFPEWTQGLTIKKTMSSFKKTRYLKVVVKHFLSI
ncbi:MAG: hypothetical protein ACI9FN_000759 [Saprospiraceae bacterium]|jgi:hypothetical protein